MCDSLDPVLDSASDVRDDLHCFSEVVALPLLLNDVRVDFARGEVVVSAKGDVQVALVVAQVEVSFTAVVEDVDLA